MSLLLGHVHEGGLFYDSRSNTTALFHTPFQVSQLFHLRIQRPAIAFVTPSHQSAIGFECCEGRMGGAQLLDVAPWEKLPDVSVVSRVPSEKESAAAKG